MYEPNTDYLSNNGLWVSNNRFYNKTKKEQNVDGRSHTSGKSQKIYRNVSTFYGLLLDYVHYSSIFLIQIKYSKI